MRLPELFAGVDVVERRGNDAAEISAVAHDSRSVMPGSLFCCIPGARSDGHDYASEATAAGAQALLVERFVDVDVPQLRVARVRDVIGALAARIAGYPSRRLRLIGVTGTNGKTTTTYMLDSIARAGAGPAGLIGTVETRIGDAVLEQPRTTPEAPELQSLLAQMVAAGVANAAMEVSSHALAMGRVRGTSFASVAFTNLAQDHLDFHGDLDSYFAAKSSLFDPEYSANAAVNIDDERGEALAGAAEGRGLEVLRFGIDSSRADVNARILRVMSSGTEVAFEDRRGDRRSTIESNSVGAYNVSNLACAAAAALASGYEWDSIVAGLSAPIVVPGRLERVGSEAVFVDYAHTPDALNAVTAALRSHFGDACRLIVVFGAGGDRDRSKRPLMGKAVARGADVAVVTSDNPRSEQPEAIITDILDGVDPVDVELHVEPDRRAAIALGLSLSRPGDVVLVAGKGHESGQESDGVIVAFDDRVVIGEELGALGCS